jgi:hypothetical protein
MSEGEAKPKTKTMPAPTEAELALAKKLGRALGRNPTGQNALGRNPTGANAAPSSRNITASTNPVTSAHKSSDAPISPNSEREAVLAARRASVQPGEKRSIRPTSRAPVAARPRARKSIIALGALLLVAGLTAGGVYIKQTLDARSPAGRVRNELLSWELAAAESERAEAFANLDKGAPSTIVTAVDMLLDASRAQRADSNSQRTVQVVAHHYLMHYAAVVKAPPPREAAELGKKLYDGAPVAADMWTRARDAWRAWIAEQQSKGSVPKA